MADLQQHDGANQNPLPDGIGLDLEAVRILLAQKHETVISADDPVLMLVTLNNAFLAEYEKLLDRHNKALTAMLAEKTDGYVAGVLKATQRLTKDLSAASVESIHTVLRDHGAVLTTFRNQLAWLSAIVAISALVNVAVFAFRAIK